MPRLSVLGHPVHPILQAILASLLPDSLLAWADLASL